MLRRRPVARAAVTTAVVVGTATRTRTESSAVRTDAVAEPRFFE